MLLTSNAKQAVGSGQQFGYRLSQFLKDNIANYPLYEQCNDCKEKESGSSWGVW
jgi:hypothetical protein